MCGRFGLWLEEGIFHRFNIDDRSTSIPTGYNIAPGMKAFVVTHNSPNQGRVMQWGLLPPWAKDPRIAFKMINARAETITERPAYRNCFTSKRCLVPFNAFYEWSREGDKKTPYLVFAGLYELAHDADGKEIWSFTIITTAANNKMRGIHERMPVILSRNEEDVWLDKDVRQEELLGLLDGYTAQTFEHYQVSERVNSAQNNDSSLIDRAVNYPNL